MLPEKIDVVVVGAGNAAMSTALAAAEKGCSVQVLERAPEEECGVTFTFGGLKIDKQGRVIDTDGGPIAGLYAAGKLVGGLFYFNYPGGSGLMSDMVSAASPAPAPTNARQATEEVAGHA